MRRLHVEGIAVWKCLKVDFILLKFSFEENGLGKGENITKKTDGACHLPLRK